MAGEQEPGARGNVDRSFLRLEPGSQGKCAQKQSQTLTERPHV